MKRIYSIIGVLAILGIVTSGVPTLAQTSDESLFPVPPVVTEERVTLIAGDTFEIAAQTGIKDATYSWIMTQGRTFIEAQREQFFRYRFVNDNEYTLRAEAVLPTTGERFQRTFVIQVLPSGSPALPTPPKAGTGAAIAGTIPAPDANGRVVFADEQQLVKLVPLRIDLTPLAVDFDIATDGDGDGNPSNDIDNINTDNGFHSFGKPLWVWYAKPVTHIDLSITAIPTEGSPLVQGISVMSEEGARIQGVLTSPVSITAEQTEDATFTFMPVVAPEVQGINPLLYEWQFGDGGRSLETLAVHTYASEGPFEVSLSVRDLQTGRDIGSAKTSVSPIIAVPIPTEPTDPIPTEPTDPIPTEPTEPTDNESSLNWGRIALIAGLFIGALILGFAVIWLLSFLRKSRKLEQTLESMENTIAPSKDQSPPSLAIKSKQPAPAASEKPTTGQQKIIDAEISSSSSPKATAAQVVEEKAPDWLKKGLAANAQQAPATPSPASTTAAPKAPSAAPTPAPKPVSPPVVATPPTPPKPAPAPTPKVATPPIAQATGTAVPQTATAPDPNKMPRWLQQPSAAPQPPPAAPTPAAVTPTPTSVPTAAPIAPPIPAAPATQVATPPAPTSQSPKPVPAAPKPTIPAAPTPAPAPVASVPTPAPAPSPAPAIPAPTAPPTTATPLSPTQPLNTGKDDDQPIAIIRADSIDPGPKK